VGVDGLFDSIVNAVTGGGNPVAAAAQSLAPAVSAAIGGQSAANPNQTWQKWQQVHPGTPYSDYQNWWNQYGQSGGTISGVGLGSPYSDALSAVGLSPDNPDSMYDQLQFFFRDPVGFKNAQKGWHGAKDAIIWSENPPGTAALQWPFHWGLWMKNAPTNDAQLRAVFKVPDGTDTTTFLKQLYKVPASIAQVRINQESWEGPDLAKVVSDVEHDVSNVTKDLSHVPWGTIIHDVQAAVSAVPGLGTAVSDVMAAAESAYDTAAAIASHNPLAAALDAAYNFALASVPGADALRTFLDPVKTTLVNIAAKHEPVESAILDGILTKVPDAPRFGKLSPRSIAASLAKHIVGKLGIKHTGTAANPLPRPAGIPAPTAPPPVAAAPRPAPSTPTPAPPVGHPPAHPHPHPHKPHAKHKYAPYPNT
jgi:hypothetical protein